MAVGSAGSILLFVVFALVALERLVELVINRRHVRWLAAAGAKFHEPDGFGLILSAQILLFLLAPIEALGAPWAGIGWWTWPLLALALGAQVLRYWVITTLGPRWCIRVATLPGRAPVAAGPYRWLRHPNYLAVGIEAFALPLAFGAYGTAVLVGGLQLVALTRRIAYEDAALAAATRATPREGDGGARPSTSDGTA